MSDFHDRYSGDADARTRAMLREFVHVQRQRQRNEPQPRPKVLSVDATGLPPHSPDVLALVADVIEEALQTGKVERLKRSRGNQQRARTDYPHFAAWYARNCDAEFMMLPRADNGWDKIAQKIGVGTGSNVKRLEKEFQEGMDEFDYLLVAEHGAQYAVQRGWPCTVETTDAMSSTMELAIRNALT